MSLLLGKEVTNGSPVELPVKALQRHLMTIGASGSGKTVLCKCVMEEAVRNNIPLIIVDPQGDIASLALRGSRKEIEKHGTSLRIQDEYFSKARVAIFTPASSKAIPISIDPVKLPPIEMAEEDSILALDLTATSLANFLGYDLETEMGRGAKAYLFKIMEYLHEEGQVIESMAQLADMALRPPEKISETVKDFVTKREPREISRRLRYLTVGTPSLMFQMGVQIDIDTFLDRSDGKTPVNIIYLNTLNSSNDKQFFLSTLLREMYYWMLKHPSESVQLLFYVDEIAPYIPPYPRNPPTKEAYSLLFKQARKYGIGLVAATQNVTDIDYKALAQVNTWCLGRLMTRQDAARVSKIIQSIDPSRADLVLQKLPSLRTGEFLVLSPDVFADVVDLQVRWLVTDHRTLDAKDLSGCIPPESRAFFEKHALRREASLRPTSDSAIEPESLDQKVRRFLDSKKQAVSAKTIARGLNVDVQIVKPSLRSLVRSGIAKQGRIRGGTENLYWLKEFGFMPSMHIVGEVLVYPTRITQVKALERSRSVLEGGFFGKSEEVYSAELSYLPIWKVSATSEVRKLTFLRSRRTHTYYISAQTGSFLTLKKKRVMFHKVVTKNIDRARSFDDENLKLIPKLPSHVDKLPKIKIGMEEVRRRLRQVVGAESASVEIVLLPVWTLKVRHKKKTMRRTIYMDAATGRLLSGSFRALSSN